MAELRPVRHQSGLHARGEGERVLALESRLALRSPIFPSSCEGKLGVALETLQGKIDLI